MILKAYKEAGFHSSLFIINMKRILLIFAILILILSDGFFNLYANEKEIDAILASAEGLFKMMKAKNYASIWSSLTEKSKGIIVDDTYKAIMKQSSTKGTQPYTKEVIREDFQRGGIISKTYWDSYFENFDPDLVLNHSSWKMGKIEEGRAEIIIQYKKSERPANLRMFKEGGIWKVGLEETFGTRKK